ncbi:hypothetical protein Tamer19_15310 [Cupriavidus sp. TA19]|nr:hypothetical protein Tamer19_15310 [Cupriavidus sp. TA19]
MSEAPLPGKTRRDPLQVAIAGPDTQGDTGEQLASLCHDRLGEQMGENAKAPAASPAHAGAPFAELPGQVVLVLQGGGALGAYQVGVYQALHEAGLEPEWVIGTSIGAINGAIIAGNPPEQRLSRLKQFWDGVAYRGAAEGSGGFRQIEDWLRVLSVTTRGIPSFFTPSPDAWWLGVRATVGLARAAFYSTSPRNLGAAGRL